MDFKRILTAVIGLPAVAIVLIIGNTIVMDLLLMVIAILCMREYFIVISKVAHPIKWVGYLSTVLIAIVSIMTVQMIQNIILFGIPIIILILFLKIIITDMNTTFKDVAYTFLGIMYITFFIMFLSLIRGTAQGKIMLGFSVVIAWSTDIFAYLVGKHLGKHKFSKISPKKSIEGCIAGTIGATICGILYIYISNTFWGLNLEMSYVLIGIICIVLSILSQIGDFVASTIKRFADAKDYGGLLPGHGGMLDRIDSLIFIAPFVYMFTFFI